MAQIKSKKRVADHGEVFTSEREVKAMCDLVANECDRIDSRFLEPACGDGNFLAEILERKLVIVKDRYRRSPYDWERNSLVALGSLYGVDILKDNCITCRERLFTIWNKAYKAVCKKECNDETRRAAKYILDRNIVCGNALSLCCVDENQKDTGVPIVFSEWSFPSNDARIRQDDYTFAMLLQENPKAKYEQQSMFEDEKPEQQSMFAQTDTSSDGEGTLIERHDPVHYRRLGMESDV